MYRPVKKWHGSKVWCEKIMYGLTFLDHQRILDRTSMVRKKRKRIFATKMKLWKIFKKWLYKYLLFQNASLNKYHIYINCSIKLFKNLFWKIKLYKFVFIWFEIDLNGLKHEKFVPKLKFSGQHRWWAEK